MTPDPPPTSSTDRYARQILFSQIGPEGQKRLARARVLLVGCGALGSVSADILVRAGVGFMRICDRDDLELNNLQRQVLYNEQDIADQLPKALAAARALARINSTVQVEPLATDVDHTNIERLGNDVDLLIDGTDNFETRYLVNDFAVHSAKPWIYGAAVAATGMSMTILPGRSPCLRCVFPEPPPADMNPTCDTVGVMAPTVHHVAAIQATEAIKLIVGDHNALNRNLINIDAWSLRFSRIDLSAARTPDCPCCGRRDFEFLDGRRASEASVLCGRNAVQVHIDAAVNLQKLASRLTGVPELTVRASDHLLRIAVGSSYGIALFPDGRAIVKGTDQPETARTVLAKYLGC